MVLSVSDGIVVRGPYPFYDCVYALDVEHSDIGIVRYGEISSCPEGIAPGVTVRRGQVIGFVGKMRTIHQPMLHFELYTGTATGPLTDRASAPYMRRVDLIDPTAFLDSCAVE